MKFQKFNALGGQWVKGILSNVTKSSCNLEWKFCKRLSEFSQT